MSTETPETERGAAEENYGAPLTETEEELSHRPPSRPAERDEQAADDES